MNLDISHPLNARVLAYLSRQGKSPSPAIASTESVRDPYYGQGSHPDIVARVWDELGASLPLDCRCLVYGTPALVHPTSGIVFATCNGTQYNLRLTPRDIEEAVQAGQPTTTRWSGGTVTDATRDLGPDWVFGNWSAHEPGWCLAICEALGN